MAKTSKSQIFSWQRYMLALRHDLRQNATSWLLRGLLMLAVTTTLMLIATWPIFEYRQDYGTEQPFNLFIVFKFCGIVFCALGASLFMENMTTNGQRCNTLMMPASTLEKFMARWTICIPGVTIGFFICFIIGDLLRVLIIHSYFPDLDELCLIGPWGVMKLAEHWYLPLTGLICCQATFMLGSTLWPKYSFVKTFAATFAFVILTVVAASAAMTHAINTYGISSSVEAVDVQRTITMTWLTVSIGWSVFAYIVAYLRTRESEIINRW